MMPARAKKPFFQGAFTANEKRDHVTVHDAL